ncbi:MAG TPA: glycosyltransferase [Candidatus Hydrogenedentes bacterium]|nr:glycosyltransferase [Candidatus Hydrogenedentota bacterium]HOL75807.1 glycosyltransferase [Candidatus Hydrogenedentota bacterium]HPO87188.1 glycosyltransferase [Candidatus Hydrogenedentota bacterium]
MIYVTVGTLFLDFARLINEMDRIAEMSGERVVAQIGLSKTIPKHCEYFDFKPREEVLALQSEARVIVTHAGIGSVLDALEARRPLLVVPRLKKFREHLTDHQIELAEAVERRGWGKVIWDINSLAEACASPPSPPAGYSSSKHRLVSAVEEFVERVSAYKMLSATGKVSKDIFRKSP